MPTIRRWIRLVTKEEDCYDLVGLKPHEYRWIMEHFENFRPGTVGHKLYLQMKAQYTSPDERAYLCDGS